MWSWPEAEDADAAASVKKRAGGLCQRRDVAECGMCTASPRRALLLPERHNYFRRKSSTLLPIVYDKEWDTRVKL